MPTDKTKIFLTCTPFSAQVWGGGDTVEKMTARLRQEPADGFELVDDEASAQIVVFWEEYQQSEVPFAPKLREAVSNMQDPRKAFTVNFEDRPIGFLPGVYVSTPAAPWSQHRYRTGAWPHNMNPHIIDAAERREQEPELLYAFIGAGRADVRRRMLAALPDRSDVFVRATEPNSYNIVADDPAKAAGQKAYIETLLNSRFFLCPRANGSSSFRLFETMQLGRVPVIISDDWVPPRGPAWQEFSIRVAEDRLDKLDEIIRQHADRAKEMGNRARTAWERWFAPEVVPLRTLEWICELSLSRPRSEENLMPYWRAWIKQAQQARPTFTQRLRRRLQRSLGC